MKLLEQLNETFDKLSSSIGRFNADELNKVPFEDSWTPGQVAEHIIKSCRGIPDVMKGTVAKTTRDPEEKIAMLNKIFLDFSTKMKSPSNIVPVKTDHTIEKLTAALSNIKQAFSAIIEKEDLTVLCKDVEFPGMGHFTRLEWISFCIVHTQRHTHQLEEINARIHQTN